MSLGSAAAFMITGPATKITNLGALEGWFSGLKNLVIYWVYIITFFMYYGASDKSYILNLDMIKG